MSGLPWFKCFPRDFRDGMMGLTCEERGAYVTLLMLIYENGAPIADAPGRIAAYLTVSTKTWTKLRAALIVAGKITVVTVDGAEHLTNKRAEQEIAAQEALRSRFSEAAKKAREKKTEPNEISDTPEPRLEPALTLGPASSPKIEEEEVEEERIPPVTAIAVPAPPKGRAPAKAKGLRFVPEDWAPKESHARKLMDLGYTPEQAQLLAMGYVNHEFKAPKTDFDRAFFTWISNDASRRGFDGRQTAGFSGGGSARSQARDAAMFAGLAEARRRHGQRREGGYPADSDQSDPAGGGDAAAAGARRRRWC